jgi:L-ascorbate metabolism protein UlaG (beta-lactamase superfamily)
VKLRLRIALATGGLALLGLALLGADGCAAFGARATGARRQRMERSPQWSGGRFHNPQPLHNQVWTMVQGLFHASPYRSPAQPPPVVRGDRRSFEAAPGSGLRVTWLGHSSTIVELDGQRLLTDPIWSERASPFRWTGPRRWFPPPIALTEVGRIDAVLISHDHYDHLDRDTIVALRDRAVVFIVPLGVGAHLARWGVDETRIVELDWWQATRVGDVTVTCTPARHASGRLLLDNDAKLWAGYAMVGPRHRVYFSGDTGLFPALRQVGARLGPFDLTMIEVGEYDRAWPDWHSGPEQAVQAHLMLAGRVMLPVHWGLFNLAYHGWTEPIERALVAAGSAGVTIVAPRPGASFEPDAPPPVERWWPSVPWQTALQHPVVSTQMQ